MSKQKREMEFKEGQLWRSTNGKHHGWCRHGLFRIQYFGKALVAVDTYWGGAQTCPSNYYPVEEIKNDLEFVIDLTACKSVGRDTYDKHAEADRAFIPVGGGSEQFFVRSNSTPDKENSVDFWKRALRANLHEASFALRCAEEAFREIEQLEYASEAKMAEAEKEGDDVENGQKGQAERLRWRPACVPVP